MSFWDIIWFIFVSFVFIAYLMMLFNIISDIFRDRELHGVAKAIWLIALLVFPFLTALVYVIARGRGMARRADERAARQDHVHRSSAGWIASPATEIAKAKELMDTGTINQSEFEAVKAKALAAEATTTAPNF